MACQPTTLDARRLARLAGLPLDRLRRWQRAGLVARRDQYGWADLQVARKLAAWSKPPLSPRRLYRSLRAARVRLHELRDPWLEAGFAVFANRLEVHCRGFYMDALTGQYRLPFPVDPALRRLEPSSPSPSGGEAERWFAYGLSLEGQAGMRPQAEAAYRRCLELNPKFGSAYINLGTLHYHERNFEFAERCYRQAVELDPAYALGWFNLGNVFDETGRLPLALDAYRRAVQLAPDYADAHYNLALAYQRHGWPRRALPHWRAYLAQDRASPWAVHARAQLKQALAGDVLQLVGGA